MKKLITDYQKEVEKKIKNKTFTKEDLDDFKVMVGYFEHERLIHLLVTITVIIFLFFTNIPLPLPPFSDRTGRRQTDP